MLKYIIFFAAVLCVLLYTVTFFENKQKVKARILGKEREISLGLLLFSAFLDGGILSLALYFVLSR
ncbi:MAG: hypothetical protein UV80_C0002G0157 [Candidatus Peregrinibacteria bacterium GW2011_GWF2_43_17]|nr:MAG: hypothetical protein UV80_C0002G0157 [Candidatus Peregrinibacteria bacterium GW2011_GWF2_43_17]KKT20239.1 MAG: hypothetical protein UW03_C0007G0039 [Candidatus Peregrinibacteria bacterium GW2011_GWA2_43_8]HAU39799.1 hypothetical protein [Candidatus Peregrinibacteria bacterium]